uniref:COP9 signalosome complex subunit 3 n=1 Tax=Caenorhabditis japonica TaxID=281687 RepID=A0A8R1I2V0_CAEJA
MKGKFSDYKQLAEVHFVRSKNTHSRVEEIIQGSKDKLKKDGNFLLAKLVVLEMKKKSIMSLVKMFSSIRIQEISELAFLKNQQQTTEIIDELVKENRITVRVEGDMVFWSEVKSVPSKIEIERKIKLVDQLNRVLTNKNTSVANGSGRLRPTVLYNDDEGLSMNPIDQ